MLLSLLSNKEKLKFLDLAVYMIDIDGDTTEVETRLLKMLLAEVGEEVSKEYSFEHSEEIEGTIKFFNESSLVVRKIVYMELVKVSLIDEFYNTNEHFFLEKIRKTYEITDKMKHDLIQCVYDERDLREKFRRVIVGDTVL